ncbi:MAG: trigger factor [Clostridiales bacterium]|nr:trigger factor [Clostridiales bacterium]
MNYQLEKLDGKVKFTFTILPEEWEAEINNVYLKSKNRFSIPGFRKGHAPRKTIERYYGQGVFFDDAINNCIKKGYTKALDENADVYPVDEPQVDIAKFEADEIIFTLEVTVKPEVKLGAYTGMNLEKVEYTVKQAEVKAAIERDKKAHVRKVEIKDRAVQNGDKLTIDYSGKVDGVKFDGGTAEKQELTIGSKMFIPGFEEQLIGMNMGETKDISVKFPEEYHAKDLAGKDAIFTVTVHSGVVEEIPEDNDDFAQEMGPYETFADYKKDVEKKLKADAKRRADMAEENAVIAAVVENAQVTVPDCMVETQLNYELQDLSYRLSASGLKIEDYFKYIGSSEKDFKEERRADAATTVRTRLVVEALIKELTEAGNIEVSDKEVDEKLAEFAEGGKMTVEQLKNAGQGEYLKNDMLMTKAIAFLKKNNTFEKKAKATKAVEEKAEEATETAKKPASKAKKSTKKESE